jgi:hypothetical protein
MKTILIPLAAFAVTVTGASAFNSDMLKRAGLNDDQIAAFEEAKELKESGDKEKARDVLIAAGVDEDVIKQVREAMREHADAVKEAIEDNDYSDFRVAVAGSPLADIINTEADFDRLVEAHEFMQSGDKEAAKDIFDDLGFPHWGFFGKFKTEHDFEFMSRFSNEQQAELREAMADGDKERVREIFAEAGVEWPAFKNGWKHGWKNHDDKKGSGHKGNWMKDR